MTQTGSNRILLGILLLLGAASIFMVYLGIQTLSSNDLVTSAMYIGAGLVGFIITGYRLFVIRKVSRTKNESQLDVFTTIECTQCEKKIERPFTRGDYVCKNIGPCGGCSGQQVITKISTPQKTQKRVS